MIDISKKSWQKYLLFGSLYFSEGLQGALTVVIIPIYLLDKGISIQFVTLVAGIGGAPWYLKFVFAPLTDYFCQLGRKPFIIVGGVTWSHWSFRSYLYRPPCFTHTIYTLFVYQPSWYHKS